MTAILSGYLFGRSTHEVFWPSLDEDTASHVLEAETGYLVTGYGEEETWTEVVRLVRAKPIESNVHCTAEECDEIASAPGFEERVSEWLADRACAQAEAANEARWER